jgi:glycosyltransferase involved in cell wall biosynthesis
VNILFLSRWYPYPCDNGAKLRVYNLIRALAVNHSVDLISFADEPIEGERLKAMQELCRWVGTARYQSFQPRRISSLLALFSPTPRAFVDTYRQEIAELVISFCRKAAYDVVIASELDMARYALLTKGPVRVLEEIQVGEYVEALRHAESTFSGVRRRLTWWKLAGYLRRLMNEFDAATVVSSLERAHLARAGIPVERVQIIPNGVDMRKVRPSVQPQPDTLIYSGSLTYSANLDAVVFFLREIFPQIRAHQPRVTLTVTGRLDGVDLAKLPNLPGVIFTGHLADVAPAIAGSWLSVVPLRQGGGTRLKVLESLSLGTPVVSTPKGVEGLDLIPNEDVLVAEDPSQFAAAVIRVLKDSRLRSKLSQAGKQQVARLYDWEKIGDDFCRFLEVLVAGRNDALRPDFSKTEKVYRHVIDPS